MKIPGAILSITLHPQERATRKGVTALHGMVSTIRAKNHHPHQADFALFPSHAGSGWSIYLPSDDEVRDLAGTEHRVKVGERSAKLLFGLPRAVPDGPCVRGRQRLRLHAISPVVIRSMGGKVARTEPTGESLTSTLRGTLARRIGVPLDGVDVLVTADHSRPVLEHMPKLGYVRGWVGSVDVDASERAAALLYAAQHVGLGGRVGYGCGRVIVEEKTSPKS